MLGQRVFAMQETAQLPFPQDEVEERIKLLIRVLPGLGMNLLAQQKDSYIGSSASDEGDRELMERVEGRVERELVDTLTGSFPDDRIFGEVHGRAGQSESEFDWWIDALDGTRNFIHGLPHFAVSAGLCFRGSPVAGVVLAPFFQDVYHAIYGAGAFKNHEPISVSPVADAERSLVATGLPYRRQEIIGEILADINAFILSNAGLRRSGSAILDMCWIAEGRLDAMWERGLSPHDTVSSSIIVREAGGQLSSFDGKPFDVHIPNVIASNGLLHPRIVEILSKARKVEGWN